MKLVQLSGVNDRIILSKAIETQNITSETKDNIEGTQKIMKYSVVVPVYNSSKSLKKLCQRIDSVIYQNR